MKHTWISAVCAAFAAFGIARFVPARADADHRAETTSPRRVAARWERPDVPKSSAAQARIPRAPKESYRVAWDSLAGRKLERNQRIKAQRGLFDAWAEVDLRGAIDAALGERWDISGDGAQELLASRVLVERSEDVWRLIRSGDLGGPASSLLLGSWLKAVAGKDPDLATGYLSELKGLELRNALQAIRFGNQSGQAAEKIWVSVIGRQDLSTGDRAIIGGVLGTLGQAMSATSLREMTGNPNALQAEAAARALAGRIQSQGGSIDYDAEIDSVPAHVRPAMAAAFLANSWGRADCVMKSVEFLTAAGEWELLASGNAASSVSNLARNVDPRELADWVSRLPSREETAEMFHRGVEPFIQKDRDAAWEWMSGLNPGPWRDRAFAEYSQQALNRWNDPQASRTALDQIEDPAFKATAEKWRHDWEERTGRRTQ